MSGLGGITTLGYHTINCSFSFIICIYSLLQEKFLPNPEIKQKNFDIKFRKEFLIMRSVGSMNRGN